jgi:hypothetical protein
MNARTIAVHPPDEAAKLLGGISVGTLVALLKAKGYAYTELKPGARPWGRGRQLWGLTDDQIAAVVAGQARRFASPEAPVARPPAVGLAAHGHDGKSRLRRGRRKA